MNLLNVEFLELYRRHLCRHSQFGINVLHLMGVAGIYVSLFAIAFALPGTPWIIGVGLSIYLGILAANIPFRLLLINAAFVLFLLLLFRSLPDINVWVYVVMIFIWHRFQIWNHKLFDKHHDMSEFEQKYQKGFLLFVLLSLYELPILLNYLVFDRRNWTT